MGKEKEPQQLNEQLSAKGHLSTISQGPVGLGKSLSTTGHLATLPAQQPPASNTAPASTGTSSSGPGKGGK